MFKNLEDNVIKYGKVEEKKAREFIGKLTANNYPSTWEYFDEREGSSVTFLVNHASPFELNVMYVKPKKELNITFHKCENFAEDGTYILDLLDTKDLELIDE
jgi:hypothetical protein